MNKKVVLIIDEDSRRTERLDFIVRLGGYETQSFESGAAALNWVRCASPEEVLCILFNNSGGMNRIDGIVATWIDTGKIVPVVLVRRDKFELNQNFAIDKMDHIFICEPESVMQTLEILSAIEYDETSFALPQKRSLANGEGLR